MARIYVGTYAKYNSGSIAGDWLDLEDYADSGEFYAACRALHADEADPEFMFQDWEDIPEGMVSESSMSSDIWEWLELDDGDRELLAVYREHVDQSGDIEDARDAYSGTYDSPAAYAEELTRDTSDIPAYLDGYIDWERMARDMGFEGTTFVSHEGSTWVFNAS